MSTISTKMRNIQKLEKVSMTMLIAHCSGKTKEFYKAKSSELEKLKRESPSPKELEKAETKFRKAQVFRLSEREQQNHSSSPSG